jgi:sporulation protein YlmC with PRC-barrel domain
MRISRKENAVQLPDEDQDSEKLDTELTVSGVLHLHQAGESEVDVRRGMVILTSEGQEAGRVAAVIVDRQDQHVTHILLTRLGQLPEYRLVPIALVKQVREATVQLAIFSQVVNTLPLWHGS